MMADDHEAQKLASILSANIRSRNNATRKPSIMQVLESLGADDHMFFTFERIWDGNYSGLA